MQLSRGQRIFRVVGGMVFALILIILYAPFLIMGVLSFAERTTAVFPPKRLLVHLLPEALQPERFLALPHPR